MTGTSPLPRPAPPAIQDMGPTRLACPRADQGRAPLILSQFTNGRLAGPVPTCCDRDDGTGGTFTADSRHPHSR